MPTAADFEVVCPRIDKILPGDMEIYPFTLPDNLRHDEKDRPFVIVVTFNVVKAKNLKWELLVNDATESQFFYSGDCVLTWQLFPEAAQFHPGENQLAVYVKPSGKGILEVKGIVLHFRVQL